MSSVEKADQPIPLSATDYHILMVLAEQDLYGYAIMKAVEEDSDGAVSPGIGSLYRMLARLTALGWVAEVPPPTSSAEEHRGRPRQYYRLTGEGRNVLRRESLRLDSVLQLARERKLLAGGSG
jgi:DNA-binding PadR family transcriptional regulator